MKNEEVWVSLELFSSFERDIFYKKKIMESTTSRKSKKCFTDHQIAKNKFQNNLDEYVKLNVL